jgi:hypothetical protein
VEVPHGELVLVDTKRTPAVGDKVLVNDTFKAYELGMLISGVAYCTISFL